MTRSSEKSGHFLAAQALQLVHTVATIRAPAGKVSVTDGPFAATNEQLGGFILIDATDLNEAIQVLSQIPIIRLGGVEARPTQEQIRS
jgi:hypothetical protein